jgi:hypothetical protein
MVDFTEAFKLIGAAAGVAAFAWNFWTPLRSYLVLTMDVRKPDGSEAIVKVTVANSGLLSKLISYAVLTVTPESLPLADAINGVLGSPPSSPGGEPVVQSSAIARLFRDAGDQRRYGTESAILPLNELYGDQAMVGPGETVTYACSINLANLKPETVYVVRFFVFVLYAGFYLRWRFTSDALRYSTGKIEQAT